MSDKKFSDFTSVNVLQDNEFLATELLGVENRKITFNDFANQIQNRLLPLSYSDIGCIKSSLIAPSDNKQPNMIYCDGSTYYASNPNPLISKFINAVYQYEALRNFLQIPADKSSFKTPDLRNQHLVGAGSGNTAYQYITSKVMNFISGVSTTTNVSTNITINNAGAHTHNLTIPKTLASGGGQDGIYGSGQTQPSKTYATDSQGNHTHTATASSTATSTTTLNYNNNLIDTINRVPALAVYHYIDIAVDRFNLDPSAGGVAITIGDVVGLQTALDLKADITLLNNYATISALDTGLEGKANITDITKPALVSIPVLATTIADGAIVNLNLGTPVLLSGDGVVGDYVSVVNNIIKTTNINKRVVSFSAGILANYSSSNNTRSYRLLVRRPAVVSVAGTNANDILNENTDVKLNTTTIADSEFQFASTFTNGVNDPFNIDGFIVSLDNISGITITTITSRTGYAKQSYIRIEFK